jgi:hypothetical protein
MGGKKLVMKMIGNEEKNVRYEEMIEVKKMMVKKWE